MLTLDNKKRIKKVLFLLKKEYPNARIPLRYKNPLQLLVATILSAQCTDERVNMVTPALFEKYKTAGDFAKAEIAELEKMIKPTGFYKSKARNIVGCCRSLVERHGGSVPKVMEELTKLPGVGRKTANVVLAGCWNIPGVIVDTHVKRLTRLMGFTKNSDADKIEQDIMKLLPKDDWNDFSMCLIYHGRKVCIARRPRCYECVVNKLCPSFKAR